MLKVENNIIGGGYQRTDINKMIINLQDHQCLQQEEQRPGDELHVARCGDFSAYIVRYRANGRQERGKNKQARYFCSNFKVKRIPSDLNNHGNMVNEEHATYNNLLNVNP